MTREEAKTILHEKFSKPIMFGEVNNLIDAIFDDFESRTCENCKYFTECGDEFNYCDKNSVFNGLISKNFGCNKWEAKDD